MTLNFTFGYTKNDGRSNLEIRFKDQEKDSRIKIEGVCLEKKYWDKKINRVKTMHPNYEALNSKIDKAYKKIIDVKQKYELNLITYDQGVSMLKSKGPVNTLKEFVEIHCQNKSKETIRNYFESISAFEKHTKISHSKFSDVTFVNLEKMKHTILNNGLSPHTFNKYLRDIKAICNYAKRLNTTFIDFNFNKGNQAKTDPINKIVTISTSQIIKSIENVSIQSNHRSAKRKVLKQYQAISFWLLMFSLRGFYPKDIEILSSKNIKYDFEKYFGEMINSDEEPRSEEYGNSNIYYHKRSKTKYPMIIWITMPPIKHLINLCAKITHLTEPQMLEEIVDDFEELAIFPINEKSKKEFWRNLNKHLKSTGIPDFKSARKTFQTTATWINIPQPISRTLLGQKDQSISSKYNNFEDPKLLINLFKAHQKIIKSFKLTELYLLLNHKVESFINDQYEAPKNSIEITAEKINSYYEKRLEIILPNIDENIEFNY